jgi:tRNA(fMet)-specific endonuclease VapC
VIAAGEGRALDLPGEVAISSMTLAELHVGVLVAGDEPTRAQRLALLTAVESTVSVLAIEARAARALGRLVAESRRRGQRPGIADALIAATAIANGMPLVTFDEDFDAFEELDVVRPA